MSKIRYEDRRFTPEARTVVATADAICSEYAAQGYTLSLRGLYYQFIRRDQFPDSRLQEVTDRVTGDRTLTKNHLRNYKWLSDLVSDARIAGLVDWSHIEDSTRETVGGDGGWESPASAVASVPRWYTISKWDEQPSYLEVWVEKEALLQIVSQAASRWNVAALACKGNPSTSAVHEAARRLRAEERDGRKTEIIYLGDHDPTGLDISRDVQDRLAMFRSTCQVDRIALNFDQITDDMPPAPAKLTDSRAAGYVDQYGDDTWELDALEPAVLDQMVEDAILGRLDRELWDARVAREDQEKRILQDLADNWDEVRGLMVSAGITEDQEDEDI